MTSKEKTPVAGNRHKVEKYRNQLDRVNCILGSHQHHAQKELEKVTQSEFARTAEVTAAQARVDALNTLRYALEELGTLNTSAK